MLALHGPEAKVPAVRSAESQSGNPMLDARYSSAVLLLGSGLPDAVPHALARRA
jgi:hypothetical protein